MEGRPWDRDVFRNSCDVDVCFQYTKFWKLFYVYGGTMSLEGNKIIKRGKRCGNIEMFFCSFLCLSVK